jgi:hypothetical protein
MKVDRVDKQPIDNDLRSLEPLPAGIKDAQRPENSPMSRSMASHTYNNFRPPNGRM